MVDKVYNVLFLCTGNSARRAHSASRPKCSSKTTPRSRGRSRISSSAPLPPRSRLTSATPSEEQLEGEPHPLGRVLDAGKGVRDVAEQILAPAQVAALVAQRDAHPSILSFLSDH